MMTDRPPPNSAAPRQKRATRCTTRNDLCPLDGMTIISRPSRDLLANSHNARTHDDRQISKIVASIREFGFLNPILVNREGQIVAGHARNEAAKIIGMAHVPTICIDHLTGDQLRAYAIAENRLAELAGWDRGLLAVELEYLASIETDFIVEITGFETSEIDLLIDEHNAVSGDDPADRMPESSESDVAVSRLGDIWLPGEHRLLCGDALEEDSYENVMGSERAHMVCADAPYNVPVTGHVCGLGKIQHREFAMASGEMSEEQFTTFLATVLTRLASRTVKGGLLYMFMDWRHLYELLSAGRSVGLDQTNICIWNKTNAGMGSLYRSKHELVCVFKNGTEPHLNNVQLGKYGRYRTNVWDYAGVNTFRRGRQEELSAHPTAKPVALVADAIRDVTRRGNIVLDAFAGSGTTILAAERTGRRAMAIEIDPLYVDVAVRRWQALTGKAAVHTETGLTFSEMATLRATEAVAAPSAPMLTRDPSPDPDCNVPHGSVRHRTRPVDGSTPAGRA